MKPVEEADIEVDASGTGTMRQVKVRADRTGCPRCSSKLRPGWTAGSPRPCLWAATRLFVGEVVGFGFSEGGEDAPVLRMEDTRMNYGG